MNTEQLLQHAADRHQALLAGGSRHCPKPCRGLSWSQRLQTWLAQTKALYSAAALNQ